MNDLISRQAAIDALKMDVDIIPYVKAREYAHAVLDTMLNRLEQLPAAQPEIVRCKDCKYWQDNNGGYINFECRWWSEETPEPDDFCSYGERKENETN